MLTLKTINKTHKAFFMQFNVVLISNYKIPSYSKQAYHEIPLFKIFFFYSLKFVASYRYKWFPHRPHSFKHSMQMTILGQYYIGVNMIKYNDLNNNRTRIKILLQLSPAIYLSC